MDHASMIVKAKKKQLKAKKASSKRHMKNLGKMLCIHKSEEEKFCIAKKAIWQKADAKIRKGKIEITNKHTKSLLDKASRALG